jgi:hypothetical protein
MMADLLVEVRVVVHARSRHVLGPALRDARGALVPLELAAVAARIRAVLVHQVEELPLLLGHLRQQAAVRAAHVVRIGLDRITAARIGVVAAAARVYAARVAVGQALQGDAVAEIAARVAGRAGAPRTGLRAEALAGPGVADAHAAAAAIGLHRARIAHSARARAWIEGSVGVVAVR